MHLTQEEIKHFQDKLFAEKEHLEHELAILGKKTGEGEYKTRINDMGNGEEETASEVEEYVDNLGIEAKLEYRLHEVLAALDRITAGTYGICEKTGQPIAKERLEAYPSARVAIHTK
jgi:RNA polymerase-binding transcription factor DksA